MRARYINLLPPVSSEGPTGSSTIEPHSPGSPSWRRKNTGSLTPASALRRVAGTAPTKYVLSDAKVFARRAPVTNQGVGSSNLSGRALFSYVVLS